MSTEPGPSQTVPDDDLGPSQTVPDGDPGPSQTVSDKNPGPSQTVSDKDPGPSQTVSDKDPGPSQAVSDENPGPSQTVPDEDPGHSQTVPDEDPGPSQILSDKNPDPSQTVSDEDPGPCQTVSDENPGPSQTVPDEDHGHSQMAVPDEYPGPSQTVPDEDPGPSQTVPDEVPGPSQTLPDEDSGPSQTVPNEDPGHSKTVPDKDPDHSQTVPDEVPGPSQTLPDEDSGPSQTVPNEDPGHSKTVPDKDPDHSQTVSDEDLGPSQMVSDENPGPSQTVSDEDPSLGQTASDKDPSSDQTVSDEDTGPSQTVSDEDLSPGQTVSDEDTGPGQTVSDEDPGIINTSRSNSSGDSSYRSSRNSSGGSVCISCGAISDDISLNMSTSSTDDSGVRFVVAVHMGHRKETTAELHVFVTLRDCVGRATRPHQLRGLSAAAVEGGTVLSYPLPDESWLSDVDSIELRCEFHDGIEKPPEDLTTVKDRQKRLSSEGLCDKSDWLLENMTVLKDRQKRWGRAARRDATNALLEDVLLKTEDPQKLTDGDRAGRCADLLKRKDRKKRLSRAVWCDRAGSVFVELVTVVDRHSQRRFVFPLHRWLGGRLYRVRQYDMSLPHQDDDPMAVTLRRAELVHKRLTYHYRQPPCNAEKQMRGVPEEENFPDICEERAASPGTTADKWSSLTELTEAVRSTLGGTDAMAHWDLDRWFGIQRLQGVNAKLITLCTAIPDKLGVDPAMLEPFLENSTLEEAVLNNKLFIVDLHILEGIETADGTELCCPIAIFYLNKNVDLMPVAIQLFQKKGADNPVFLPSDPSNLWLLAKMFYNNAEAQHHQICTHLGVQYLLMESVATSLHRCLSPTHPLHRLLAPHLVYHMATTDRVRREVLSAGGWLDRCGSVSARGRHELTSRSLQAWRLDTCGVIPREIASRGVACRLVLPYYPYRDDACALYAAIERYVRTVVSSVYGDSLNLRRDFELLQWHRELSRPRHQGGVGLPGVAGDTQTGFSSVDQLVEVVTALIATCTVGHAAASYGQYDQYGSVPNYPLRLHGRAPPSKERTPSEADLMQCLPGRDVTREILVFTKLLSRRGTKSLGDFEMRYLYDPVSSLAAENLRAEMLETGRSISERNDVAEFPYRWLDPIGVTNSVGAWQAPWME